MLTGSRQLCLFAIGLLYSPCLLSGRPPWDCQRRMGNRLLSTCEAFMRTSANYDSNTAISVSDSVDAGFCSGYVMDLVDDHFSLQIDDKTPLDPTRYFCLPDGVTPKQTIRVLVKWLEDHPARLHERAIGLAISALRENFECHQPQ